jgi:protein SCO1/2
MRIFKTLFILLLLPIYLCGQSPQINLPEIEIGLDEKLNTYIPKDITLINEKADTIQFESLLGKPTVLSLVYYRCPGICTPLMDGLADVIKKSDLIIDKDYQVLTVGFNPAEGIDLALKKKNNYLNILNMKDVANGWRFFTTDSINIARLTSAVGFRYKKSGNDYIHTATLIFFDKDGKITRYLNGISFQPFEFKMAILETSKGQSGPTINKVLQYCFSYDPEAHHYVLSVTRISGILIIFIAVLIFLSLATRNLIKIKRK